MNLSRLRHDSRLQRHTLLAFYAALISTAMALTALLSWLIPWSRAGLLADRLAETADILAAGTLALAFIAALVALQAYAAATGLPDLEFQVSFPFSYPNRPVFRATAGEAGNLQAVRFKQTSAAIQVHNTSGYSARNPAVIIRLTGMAFSPDRLAEGWAQVDFAQTQGIIAVQWDGGAYSIHGRSGRRLPPLNLDRLHTIPSWGEPKFVIELLAEGGYRREIELPARFTADDDDREWGKELPAGDQPPHWL